MAETNHLTTFEVFCEMVANDAKPLALSHPMPPDQVNDYWQDFLSIADKYSVEVYKEEDFPVSKLFPADVTKDKSVVIIYKGNRLKQYQQWKADVNRSSSQDQDFVLARRFGRLLGYSPHGINELLIKNSQYRSLASFGVRLQITHLYYQNLDEAINFYANTLGLEKLDSSKFLISEGACLELHSFDQVHHPEQPKATAIAFLTDQLAPWYQHIQDQKVPIKYTYKPREGGPHDGFVAIDPGGYLLEFEQFKQHPENELFMAVLADVKPYITGNNNLGFYGNITWTYHKDLLLMQQFYEETLGFRLVADQGWTKIYQTTSAGFIGLVDEKRGMENFAPDKAVEIQWEVVEKSDFDSYATEHWKTYQYLNYSCFGPENYIYRFGRYKL